MKLKKGKFYNERKTHFIGLIRNDDRELKIAVGSNFSQKRPVAHASQ